MTNNNSYSRGMIFSLINLFSLGILGIVDKVGIQQSLSPLVFSTQSLFISLLTTFIFALIYFKGKFTQNSKNIPVSYWILIILVGISGSGIFILLRFLGLTQSTGTFATLSQVITTSLTAILAWTFLKERLSKSFWIFFTVIIFSTYFVSVGSLVLSNIKLGDIFILSGTLFLAVSNIFSRIVVQKVNPILLSLGRFLFGFIFLLVATLLLNQNMLLSFSNIWVILSGLLWSIGVITFNLAIKRIGITLATALLMSAPVVTMILEYFLLNYHFTPVQIIAALVVVASGIAIIFASNTAELKLRKRI